MRSGMQVLLSNHHHHHLLYGLLYGACCGSYYNARRRGARCLPHACAPNLMLVIANQMLRQGRDADEVGADSASHRHIA